MQIDVHMLGRFEIFVDGQDILPCLYGSKKGLLLLEYLILHANKFIKSTDLYEVLWPGNKLQNPENSLKTLVSRLRNTLAIFHVRNLIQTGKASYRWNTSLNVSVDIQILESLCQQLATVSELTDVTRSLFETVLKLYCGDLLPDAGLESWIVSRSVMYHNLYLKAVRDYATLLEKEQNDSEVVRVCRKGLAIDPLDSFLTMKLMNALSNLNQGTEITAQYIHTFDLYQTRLGIQPTTDIMNYYQNMIHIEKSSGIDIETIAQEITKNSNVSGPLVCDYGILKDIYQVQVRTLSRLGVPVLLASAPVIHF